ncbi:MAG: sigma-70 family RNA polymerase sigma factor, partial [Planctomycetota bacterium]|nr:sigma-70 family RNA polymerase sigma factor [Planctomycetota bacterium]
GCLADVTKRLARHTGRSAETIRYTLKQFDQDHPDLAIFPDSSGPLQEPAKRMLYHQYRRGESVKTLARRFGRTKTSVYRVISEMRAVQIMELPLDYMPNEQFSEALGKKKKEQQILGPMPESAEPVKKPRLPAGLPSYLASLYQIPLLEREQEAHLFRKLNYLKFKASRLRDKLDPSRPKTSQMDRIEEVYDQAVATKNEIIRANLRLVVSIAKRHVGQSENFFELVSDGNISLIRAVEKFDFARGNKFSTYSSWAVMKNFARTIPDEHRHRDRFRTSHAEMFAGTEDSRSDQYEQETDHLQRRSQIEKILTRLDEREQRIIIDRFGLTRGEEPRTLKQVGSSMGVTKERVRQIEARALNKLRRAAKEDRIDIPDDSVSN